MISSRVAGVAKVALLMLAMSIVVTPGASGQGPLQDVVYLENGSVIRGTIIEQVPGESLRIRTRDGSVFFYRMEDVARITREAAVEAPARKNPGTALILAVGPGVLSLHGMGQWYNNEIGKGLLFFGAGIVGGALVLSDGPAGESQSELNRRATIGAIMWLGSLTWSSIDVYRSAHRINRDQGLAHANSGTRLTVGFDRGPRGGFEIGFTKAVAF
jgi:hypothetical protein